MNKGEGRTMRKAIATILAMGLVLSMTACGGTGGTTSENTANADSAKEESTSDGEVYEMSIALQRSIQRFAGDRNGEGVRY